MTDPAKIKVSIQLDEEEGARILAMFNKTAEAAKKLEKSTATTEQTKQQANLSASIKNSIEQYEFEDQKLNELLMTARALGKDEQFYAILHKKGYHDGIIAIQQMLGLKTQDNALTKEQIQLIQHRATELRHESIALRRGAADLHLFSQAAFVSGTAAISGVLLLAKQYADSVGEGTSLAAAQFTAATNQLKIAKNQIGEVFARESVPFLNELTDVIEKAGAFIRKYPQIVPAAIKGAELLIATGIVGKGIAVSARLTADMLAIHSSILRLIATRAVEAEAAAKQEAAAALQNAAADKQLKAGGLQASGGTATTAGGVLGKTIGSPLGIAALVLANIVVAKKTSDNLDKLKDFLNTQKNGLGDITKMFSLSVFRAVPGGQFVIIVDELKKLVNGIKGLVDKFDKSETTRAHTTPRIRNDIMNAQPGSVAFAENLDEMLDAYEKFTEDDAKLVREHYDKLREITADGLRAIEKENADFARDTDKIRRQLFRTLYKLDRDFELANQKADRKYALDRAKILRDGGDDILKIEQDLQERLRKNLLEHLQRREDLIAARDALGLVKEQRRFMQQQDEARRDADLEIARRRQDLADRLRELDIEFAEERARRLEDYQLRVKEEQQQAADRLAERQEQHDAEIKRIREETAEKLRLEHAAFADERRRLYASFIQRLRDLDAFYLGEINLERRRHAEMIANLDAFLTLYRNKLKTLGATGTVGNKAYGGYASYGLYRLGDMPSGGKGPDEFVMTGSTVRAAESIVRSRLSQRNIIAAMLARGSGKQIVWNDQRRFDSRLSAEDRRLITNDTKQIIAEMLE